MCHHSLQFYVWSYLTCEECIILMKDDAYINSCGRPGRFPRTASHNWLPVGSTRTEATPRSKFLHSSTNSHSRCLSSRKRCWRYQLSVLYATHHHHRQIKCRSQQRTRCWNTCDTTTIKVKTYNLHPASYCTREGYHRNYRETCKESCKTCTSLAALISIILCVYNIMQLAGCSQSQCTVHPWY